jgi:hypothetical protein
MRRAQQTSEMEDCVSTASGYPLENSTFSNRAQEPLLSHAKLRDTG